MINNVCSQQLLQPNNYNTIFRQPTSFYQYLCTTIKINSYNVRLINQYNLLACGEQN